MPSASRRLLTWLVLIAFLIIAGCSSDNDRLADLSRQSLDRQAEQNRLVEANNRQVIDASQKLVEAEAQARRDNSQLQQQIQSERSRISEQRDALEQERREIANQRNRDPIIAESIQAAVGVLVAVLPLAVAVYLLRGLFHRSDEESMADVLVEELLNHDLLFANPDGLCLPSDAAVLPRLPSSEAGKSRSASDGKSVTPPDPHAGPSVLVHLEGPHDVEFLRRISRVLCKQDPTIPDLDLLAANGLVAFFTSTSSSLSSIVRDQSVAEFCLYDREVPPMTDERTRLVSLLNQRSACRAVLTRKRAIENYLHPDAIRDATGVEITFGDFDDVAEIAAKATFNPKEGSSWESLSRRARRRLRDKAKKWLNREAVDRMTPERLAERDPEGEVIGWLRTIAELATAPVDASV